MKFFLFIIVFTILGILFFPQNAEAKDFYNEYISEYNEITTFCQSNISDSELIASISLVECIPQWLKTTSGWWANDLTPDSEFIQSIHYLINKGIIVIPTLEFESNKQNIPHWIKTNVGWWVDGKIDDNSFVLGIEYLIKIGIINIVTYNVIPVIF